MSRKTIATMMMLAALLPPAASAGEKEDLVQLRQTVLNLVDALVQQHVLTREQAQALVKQAEAAAVAAASQPPAGAAEKTDTVPGPAVAGEAKPPSAADPEAALADNANSKVVRVPYVPEFVKEQIREQVRSELRNDVLADVMQKAKQEKWGLPDALPAWVNSIKWYGDVRLRDQYDAFGVNNAATLDGVNNLYFNILDVNSKGGLTSSGCFADVKGCHQNTSEDQNRARARVRLGMEAKIADGLKFAARITTGNQQDPVSTNQTLGNTGQRYQIQLDQAFLQYDGVSDGGYPWLTVAAGRIANPWFSTDLVWDEDLNFEGAAVTVRHFIAGSGDLFDQQNRSRSIFATVGAFPLEDVELSGRLKWLFGAQVGADWEFNNQSKFRIGAAYYGYNHITGKRNAFDSKLTDFSAPKFLQKGNLLFDIRNDADPNTNLFALAADYKLINVTASVDLAQLAPYHVVLTGDIVKNVGYDEQEILARTGGLANAFRNGGANPNTFFKPRTLGYQMEMTLGWPQITKFGDWQVFAMYKYLQRDAVLDAFTDSDFHLGGTDAQGYVVGGKYGLTKNTWLRARWLSADEIDGTPLAIDVLQLDLSAKF